MNPKNEKSLVERASNGDAAAFGEIYFSLRDAIYGFAFRMLRQTAAAEDITQEVFMFLIENPHKYQSERGSLKAFLCGVARNKMMRYLSRENFRQEVFWDDEPSFHEPPDSSAKNPLDLLLDEELAERVEFCLGKIPALQREALILRELQELSCEEIAKITDSEIGAVKVRLHRARKSLAREIAPYLSVKKKEMNYEVR